MTPRCLAERMRTRKQANDGFVRETFSLPRDAARAKAREIPKRYPAGGYSTTVEFWKKLPDGQNLRCGAYRRPIEITVTPSKLRVGDVCRLNELGRSRSPKTLWRTAVVVSIVGRGRSYRVLPAGRKDVARIHSSYLELVPEDARDNVLS